MTFNDFIMTALQAVITAAIPVVVAFLIRWLNAGAQDTKALTKNENIRNAIDTVTSLVSDIVMYVSQTYVDALKKENAFTKEKQLEALKLAYDRAMTLIDENSKTLIESVFGDLGTYLHTIIEAAVRKQKPPEQPASPAEQTAA